MVRRVVVLAVLAAALTPASAAAGVRLTSVGAFVAPTYVTAPPGDTHRLFVVQQAGQIRLIKDGGAPSTLLDISSEVTSGGEEGLLSIAFAPDYASSRRFFVYYTSRNCPQAPGCDEHVSEFTAASGGDTASASSEHVLLTIPHPGQGNHNGGQLQFGPDGDLYISVGDGGGGNDAAGHNAQRTDRLLGKILRVSPGTASYTIPAANPFNTGQGLCSRGSNGGSSCPEIWAYGLRNPWRFSFDGATGDLAIADVGQDRGEEVDFAPRGRNVGANYGWPCYEAFERSAGAASYSECSPPPSPVVSPVLAYAHTESCSGAPFCGEGIIGGYVMHDPALPSLDGCYVYGDLSTARLRMTRIAEPRAVADADLGPTVSALTTFGQDAGGRLYAAGHAGTVYRLDEDGDRATDPSCHVAPLAATGAATNVASTSASLNGSIDPNGFASSYRFDYGTSSGYGGSTSPVAAGAGSAPVAASTPITRLSAGTVYHYRIVALRNGTPAAYGSDRTFPTKPAAARPRAPAPTLTVLTLSPRTFRAARSGPSAVRKGRSGTLVRFRLTRGASVAFAVQRLRTGRKLKGRCVRATRASRKAKRCSFWSAIKGRFVIAGTRGRNAFRFTGRIRRQALAPGRYRLLARVTGRAANGGKTARFTIRRS